MKVQNRSELLFFYDIRDGNPNGDPKNENKPRIDEETGINIVTDVRLKRTIRDYLKDNMGFEIFICQELKSDGTQKTREERIDDLKIKTREDEELLLEKYIDHRIFGALIALKGKERGRSISWIGPTQFKFGRSLHQVDLVTIKGTSVMPSKAELTTGTFIETQILHYSMICFYGIINENAAKLTKLTNEDIDLLLEGIWCGTKNLITRSKFGQMPRILLRIEYKEKNFHIGDLDRRVKLVNDDCSQLTPEQQIKIRTHNDFKLDVTELITILKSEKDKILRIEIIVDKDIEFLLNKKTIKEDEFLDALRSICEIDVLKFMC